MSDFPLLSMPDIFGTAVKSEILEELNMEDLVDETVYARATALPNGGEFKDPSLSSDGDDTDDEIDVDGVDGGHPATSEIGIVFDIQEPLKKLKKLLEAETQMELSQYYIYLQDTQRLSEHTTLVEQCLQGEGLVEVKVEIKESSGVKMINITDVIKPSSEAEERVARRGQDAGSNDMDAEEAAEVKDDDEDESMEELALKWVVSKAFRREMEHHEVPKDPYEWERGHVRLWIDWAAKEFAKAAIEPDSYHWDMEGWQLCNLSRSSFRDRVPEDPQDLFWTHIQLLKNVKFVAVVKGGPKPVEASESPAKAKGNGRKAPDGPERKTNSKPPVTLGKAKPIMLTESSTVNGGNRSGNNGQVQLWQFLLELLTDKEHRSDIHWIGDCGEFKLECPETVAQLWGTRKNKPNMNYEKLSRALRYYYDGDMISKVNGKRFVYKFVCDLKTLIGYSARELNSLVVEAEKRSFGASRDFGS